MSSSAMEALHALVPADGHHDEEQTSSAAALSSGEESGGHVLQGWAKKKRSRRQRSEEENLALCLLMLSRSGGQQRVHAPQPASSSFLAPAAAEFRCSVCGKSFGSYQALGGHKTSHRVKQPSPPADAAPLVAPATAAAVVAPAEPATSSTAASSDGAATSRVHRCTICQKEFPTGQALGGHKRKHYDGGVAASSTELLANAAAAESEVGSTGANGSSAARAFDLNIPAVPEFMWRPCAKGKMMWEDEEEVQSPLAFKKPRFLLAA